MRNKYQDEEINERNDTSFCCAACRGTFDHHQNGGLELALDDETKAERDSKFHKGYPGSDGKIHLCEDCAEQFENDFAEEIDCMHSEEIPTNLADAQSKWTVEWCLRENVFSFPKSELRAVVDVREWFECLSRFISWHCDDSFEGYVYGENSEMGKDGEPIFTKPQAKVLDESMERAMEVCEMAGLDPHAVGMNAMRDVVGTLPPDWPKQDEKAEPTLEASQVAQDSDDEACSLTSWPRRSWRAKRISPVKTP
jgi:hypothetical protein